MADILTRVRWNLNVVSIHLSLIASESELFFFFCIGHLYLIFCELFAHFIRLFLGFLFSYFYFLCVLAINLLSDS